MLEKIKNERSLKRDTETNAVLNTDNLALQRYKERRNNLKSMKQLQNEVEEIKQMLQQLLDKS